MTGQSESHAASGLYALINLDGSPVDGADARQLGLAHRPGPILAKARDAAQPLAIHHRNTANEVTLFAGFLDEAGDLAASLGLSRQADDLTIALAAWQRHGADMPYHSLGEWSFLHWRAGEGVVLVSSMPRRDRICFARVGHRIAIAPNIWALSRLPWVGDGIDEVGFRFGLMPYQVRQQAGMLTALAKVRQLPFGGSVHMAPSAETQGQSRSWRSHDSTPFLGSQDDAVAEAEALLRRLVQQRVERGGNPGALLSGGLDSSLLVWLLSETRGGQPPFPCFASAVEKGSGLANELDKARTVGDELGLPVLQIVPPEHISPYQPSIDQIVFGNGTITSARHYLYDQFAHAAAEHGVSELYDGLYGEQTVTNRYPLAGLNFRLRAFVLRLIGRHRPPPMVQSDTPIRFAPHRLRDEPPAISHAKQQNHGPAFRFPRPGERWLFARGDFMRLSPPSELLPGRVRSNFPFRDIRLWRLFAGFPTEFAVQNGMDRAPVRMMLKGRLPDSIRMQPKGLPFSPDYLHRLRNHATAQAARIPLLRRFDVDDWFDLDWLEASLRRIAVNGVANIEEATAVQMTAMNAEMLYWWRNGMGSID